MLRLSEYEQSFNSEDLIFVIHLTMNERRIRTRKVFLTIQTAQLPPCTMYNKLGSNPKIKLFNISIILL